MADTCWLSIFDPFLLLFLLTKYQHPFWGPRCPVILVFSASLVTVGGCGIEFCLLSCMGYSPMHSEKTSFSFLKEEPESLMSPHLLPWLWEEIILLLICIVSLRKKQQTKENAEKDIQSLTYRGYFSAVPMQQPVKSWLLRSKEAFYSWLNTSVTETARNHTRMSTITNII